MKKTKASLAYFKWTNSSYTLLSIFILLVLLVVYIWQPLVVEYLAQYRQDIPLWRQFDRLLIGIFLFMSIMIMAGADIKKDLPILVIGLFGGLVIEAWGTQTEIWTYYTNERPPLWIIPAWPIASLTIDRLFRMVDIVLPAWPENVFRWIHLVTLSFFMVLMAVFVWPTIDKSLTVAALLISLLLIVTAQDFRSQVLIFYCGAGLGYFLELWGTTRLCWIYYTQEQPPLFAVLAHGLAAIAFWRVLELYKQVIESKTLAVKNLNS